MTTIQPCIEFGVNYICFVHSLGEVNWRQNDPALYAGFLSSADKAVLQESKHALSFADGQAGALASVFFFLPASCRLSSSDAFHTYISMLGEAVRTGDWSPLNKKFDTELTRIRDFSPQFLTGEGCRPDSDYARQVEKIGNVFLRYIDKYKKDVWPAETAILSRVASAFSDFWDPTAIISRWEEMIQISFDTPTYDILLTAAMQNGPSANSLAFDINTFRAADTPECLQYLRVFVPHEVGTHLFVRRLLRTYPDYSLDYVPYIAMENLCHFLNTRAFGFAPYFSRNDGFYHSGYFADMYCDMSAGATYIDPMTLFLRAVEKARKSGITPAG